MSCAACAARVDKTLNGQPGVRTASVNYAAATATVEYDTAQCSPEQLKAALQAAGYDLLVGDDRKQLEDRAEQAHDEKYRRLRQRTVWAIVLALPVAVIGAGPAGLEAAVTLTKRGFDVTVFEKSDRIGGAVNLADARSANTSSAGSSTTTSA